MILTHTYAMNAGLVKLDKIYFPKFLICKHSFWVFSFIFGFVSVLWVAFSFILKDSIKEFREVMAGSDEKSIQIAPYYFCGKLKKGNFKLPDDIKNKLDQLCNYCTKKLTEFNELKDRLETENIEQTEKLKQAFNTKKDKLENELNLKLSLELQEHERKQQLVQDKYEQDKTKINTEYSKQIKEILKEHKDASEIEKQQQTTNTAFGQEFQSAADANFDFSYKKVNETKEETLLIISDRKSKEEISAKKRCDSIIAAAQNNYNEQIEVIKKALSEKTELVRNTHKNTQNQAWAEYEKANSALREEFKKHKKLINSQKTQVFMKQMMSLFIRTMSDYGFWILLSVLTLLFILIAIPLSLLLFFIRRKYLLKKNFKAIKSLVICFWVGFGIYLLVLLAFFYEMVDDGCTDILRAMLHEKNAKLFLK